MRLALTLALLLAAGPALAQTQRFDCEEGAVDLDTCTDPTDTGTCVSLTPPDFPRQSANQNVLRFIFIHDGPYVDTGLTRQAVSAFEDAIFFAARDRLCIVPAAGTPPLVCPTPGTTGGSTVIGGPGLNLGGGAAWYGGNPGINLFFR